MGLYWGEDDDCYHILGGNQFTAVTITRVSKHHLKGARWLTGQEHSNKRILLSRKGVPVSRNDA